MDLRESAAHRELRAELRAYFAALLPPDVRRRAGEEGVGGGTFREIVKMLGQDGWLGYGWPTEYGGQGKSVAEQYVFFDEVQRAGLPFPFVTVNTVGPTLMRYGTAEQKTKHLAAIASGDVIWCQGFSEPEAGTDLVSLRTRAVPDGDGWRISGQKVWTSYAGMASWCVLAACTDPAAPKHKRLTLFLIPMNRDGFTVRPIPSMLGPHHLNEMFLDGVQALPGDVLGEPGDGWRVMREALAFAVKYKLVCWGVFTYAGLDDAYVVPGPYAEL